jgi:pyruvate/2-oxoglutarate dehydrogenase complex dihydrolipoamide acyltransferase (E2) component
MGRVSFRKDYQPPVFRKIAFGTWKSAADPSVYGLLDIDMSKAMKYAEAFEQRHGLKITPTHLAAKAIAHCMAKRPEINGMIRCGRIYLREKVSIFFQVNVPGTGEDKAAKASLSGTVIHGVESMSLADIANRLARNAGEIRAGKDKAFNSTFKLIKMLPWWGARYFLNLSSWLIYGLNLDLSSIGIPKDPFGSVMITNVGGMGIDVALAPLCPYTRVPLLLSLGAIKDRAVVEDGKVVVRPVMTIGITFDHRLIDGVHAAVMSRDFKKCFAEPENYLT